MTRTARSAHPRAIIKDRSESRSGLDNSLRKSGAGQHNWGSFADEQQLENQAMEDELVDRGNEVRPVPARDASASPPMKPSMSTSTSSLSDQDLEAARKVRKNALKKAANGDIDLSAIARSSVAVGSPPSK